MKTTPEMNDLDPIETQEWKDSLSSVHEYEGANRAEFLLGELKQQAFELGLNALGSAVFSPNNTVIASETSLANEALSHINTLLSYIRWNAIMMVMRAGKFDASLGGHIASYASMAVLYEVGFHFFFRARSEACGGDLIYYQGHSVPGIYARSYLEGRFTEEQLDGYRREYSTSGLSSYPHPWLMPDYWQFPTVSMGLGPLTAIYQAQFMKYMENRGFIEKSDRKVWAFCGDGEMNEPESVGAIHIAHRERLDNLIFVINCNLQRLDGTVWGNGQIIEQFERLFEGAGWRVLKLRWGTDWCKLFAKDKTGKLKGIVSTLCDGAYQTMSSRGGAYMREVIFGSDPDLKELVSDWSDEKLAGLLDGGHDPRQVHATYQAAMDQTGSGLPTVIIAKTVKGFGMGGSGEGQNIAHNQKKMTSDDLAVFAERFNLPVTPEQRDSLSYIKPESDSPELAFMQAQRKQLGGYLPARQHVSQSLPVPPLEAFSASFEGTGEREISTTMAFSRAMSVLLKDKTLKERVVPIFADEARTFGMESFFRQMGMYSPDGQQYEPEDREKLMYYREDSKGQVLQMGLSEAGSMASWIAAGTAYSVHGEPMLPIYCYYSMFGFQRCGDLVWAASDQRARGFLFGGLSGRTSLAGEGLQHLDGQNLLMFGCVPNCVSYDPCFAYETAVVFHHGLERMLTKQDDVFFYITGTNENYAHPAMPECTKPEDIVKGMSLFGSRLEKGSLRVQLLGGGGILREVIEAAGILERDYQVGSDIWSAISFNELRKDVESVARYNRLHPSEQTKQSHVEVCLNDRSGPVIAATDHVKTYAEQIRSAVKSPYYVLGTDGFGRSDTRQSLRDFFEVDAKMIVYTALKSLYDQKKLPLETLETAISNLGIDTQRVDPESC